MQLRFDSSVYALEAVQKAAYRFIDRLTIVIANKNSELVCDIEIVPDITTPPEHLIADFKRELLDQQLRLQIKNETADVRNLILSFVFSRTGLQR